MHVCCKYIKRILFASWDSASMYPALTKGRQLKIILSYLRPCPPTGKKKGKAFLSNLGDSIKGKGAHKLSVTKPLHSEHRVCGKFGGRGAGEQAGWMQ